MKKDVYQIIESILDSIHKKYFFYLDRYIYSIHNANISALNNYLDVAHDFDNLSYYYSNFVDDYADLISAVTRIQNNLDNLSTNPLPAIDKLIQATEKKVDIHRHKVDLGFLYLKLIFDRNVKPTKF